jgi:peptide/nickel transport system substrate-binding protein
MIRRTALAGLAAAALAATGVTACADNNNTSSKGGGQPLIVEAIDQGSWQRNFNPFATSTRNMGTFGLLYEPLMFLNKLKPGSQTPWLATKADWSDGGRTLTLDLRGGVTWSDGKPFTADDVAFTFQTIMSHPELDTAGFGLTAAAASGRDKVKLTFSQPAYVKFADLVGNTPIVAKHVFAGQNPVTFANPDPVGTGPYRLKSFSAQMYDFAKNPKYWQKGKPEVAEVRFPAYTANTVQTGLQQKEIDWAGAFVPDLKKIYVQNDAAHNKYFFPPDGVVSLYPNLARGPLAKLEVRQAISLAVDRARLVKVAERGYTKVAHPSAVAMPGGEKYVPSKYHDASFKVDDAKATSLLAQAGYSASNPLHLELLVPSPYTDWVDAAQLIKEDLAKVGIDLEPRGLSVQDWVAKIGQGNYDLTIRGAVYGATPYFVMRSLLSGKLYQPVGASAKGNYERWQDSGTDAQLAKYEGTDDEKQQEQAVQGLVTTMVEKLPVLPLFYSPNWAEYRTTKYTGWPTAADPYAMAAPFQSPDLAVVLLHLRKAK